MTTTVVVGDCLDVLPTLEACSVHAVITDPPYGLEFMGKDWDRHATPAAYQAWCERWAAECLRVLKPGGHLLAFGGTRTHHRLVCALEDAGFEIRDTLVWLYGSGFPKSLDVSKAIDRMAGAERERVPLLRPALNSGTANGWGKDGHSPTAPLAGTRQVDAPATEDARQWEGWGTALKPAHEPVVVARKPLQGTVAGNVLQHGTGALNIDGCRIGMDDDDLRATTRNGDYGATSPGVVGFKNTVMRAPINSMGRWPANVVLDEDAAAMLDAQTGDVSYNRPAIWRSDGSGASGERAYNQGLGRRTAGQLRNGFGDSGGPSRFFYTAKASRSERNNGLDGMPEREVRHHEQALGNGSGGLKNGTGRVSPTANHHPTVKPVALMRWLVRLVTPPGGLVLDPFTGSGTTGVACALEGVAFLGVEREEDYAALARRRIGWAALHPADYDTDEDTDTPEQGPAQRSLFG